MTCDRIETELDSYLDEDVDPDTRWELEAHLQYCDVCRAMLERAREVQEALRVYPVSGPTPEFFDRALEAARGGAGSVQARHRSLRLSGALAAGIALLVVGGWLLRSPELTASDPVAGVSMAVHETRTVNLVFASATELDEVSLTVALPDGVELAAYRGREQVSWTTRLQAGKNVLALELVAVGGSGGELVARLRHQGDEKVFTVRVAVT